MRLIIATLVALFAASRWETWLAWRFAVPFDQADPVLGRDAGFYVFTLPFLQFVRGLGQGLVVIAALASGAIYFVSGSLAPGFGASSSRRGIAGTRDRGSVDQRCTVSLAAVTTSSPASHTA